MLYYPKSFKEMVKVTYPDLNLENTDEAEVGQILMIEYFSAMVTDEEIQNAASLEELKNLILERNLTAKKKLYNEFCNYLAEQRYLMR